MAAPRAGFPKADVRGNASENFSSQGAQLSLYSARNRYPLGEEILIKMKISNTGFYPITLYMHREYLRNFTIIARLPDGRSLPVHDLKFTRQAKDDYLDPLFANYTATNFHSRALVLQPGESFERPVVLQDLVEIPDDVEEIKIDAVFYPNPEQSPELFLTSVNTIPLIIDHHKSYDNTSFARQQMVIEPAEVTPRETVYLALSAEYIKDWPNFFKYIALKDLIADYPDFARDYMQGTSQEKAMVLDNFRQYLMTRASHRLIRFEVMNEIGENTANKAQIKVRAIRELDGFRREFYYTYYLTKASSFWRITGLLSQVTR